MQVRITRIGITTRLLSYLLLAGIVPLVLLGVSSFEISRRIIIQQAGEFHLQQMTDLSAYLELYSEQIESLSANIAGNEAIGEALSVKTVQGGSQTDSFAMLSTHAQMGYILNSYVRIKGLVSIDLFSTDGKHFHVGDTLDVSGVDHGRVRAMLEEALESPAPEYWQGIEGNLNRASTKQSVLTVTRVMRHFLPQSGKTEVVGLLVINIDANIVVSSFLSDVKAPAHLRLLLLDRHGHFIYHSDPALIGQTAAPGFVERLRSGPSIQSLRLDGEDVILAVVADPRMAGLLVGTLPRSVLTAPTAALIYAGLALFVICLVVIGLLAWHFARRVVAPVREVSKSFNSLQTHPDILPPALPLPESKDELADMVAGFNRHLDVLAAQRTAANELLVARQVADAANRAKSEFLATMSHEIRTPLNGILGMAQLLLMQDIQEHERRDYARIILNSGQTLLLLLNDILDLSKVEAGKFELESSALDPAQILHETQALFSSEASGKGLRIESAWLSPTQLYLGDPHRLRQMLSNLIGNAIKFTAKGHVRIEAREIDRDGPHALLEFSVADTGIGIAQEKQPLLFAPFSQADSSTTRQYGGTGLGLSIVRSLAKLMGGEVGVASELGQGSRFWFRIRADLLAAGMDCREHHRESEASRAEKNPGKLTGHLLVVDDNPVNRLVIKAMLDKSGGFRCDFAEDGQQAVDAVTGGMAPDLVLMDCQMPVMDGFEATQRIRRWEIENGQPRQAIVALTAGVFDDDRRRCLDSGMDDFLAKPLDVTKLLETLGVWLSGEGSRKVLASPAPQDEAPRQEGGPPVFDETTLLSLLEGDRELAKEIILSAIESVPGYLDQLEQAVAAGNWIEAERQTHTLKGLTGQIGGERLAALMKATDDHLKAGGRIDSATVIDLRSEYQILSVTLQEWIR